MIQKTLGYVLSGVGIAITALGTIPNLRTLIKIVPVAISDFYIMTLGLVLVVVGLILLVKSPGSSKKVSEVPIYHGEEVVGFRRIGKK